MGRGERVTGDEEQIAAAPLSDDEHAARHAAWWQERQAAANDLVRRGQRSWEAMRGWDKVTTQEEWFAVQDRAAEDWASGAMLITMLGGERYLAPERTALMLGLWHHYRAAYRPQGPAEYMAIAMALMAFHHLIRVNELAGNLTARLEYAFFSLNDPITVRAMQKDGYPGRVTTDLRADAGLVVEELGRDVLPLLDRLNRIVIRNIKALRDLQGGPLTVNVTNHGQLNVGQAQTNVAQPVVAAQKEAPWVESEPVRLVGKRGA